MPPTATELQSLAREQAAYTKVMAKWAAIRARAVPGHATAGKR